MSGNQETPSQAKAKRLREQIRTLDPGKKKLAGGESPREFVHRRMRELEKKTPKRR